MNTPPIDPYEDLVSDTALVIRRVQNLIPLIEELTDTRQSGSAFIPQATLAVMGEQYLKDRRARREAQIAGLPVGTGVSPVPGNMSGWVLSTEVTFALRHQLRRILTHHARTGVRPRGLWILFGDLPTTDSSNAALAGFLYELIWTVESPALIRSLEADLHQVVLSAERLIDGESRTQLPGLCPHCRNRSLVVYKESQVIRCERHRNADGRRPACLCQRTECPCRDDPSFHHSWLQEAKQFAHNSWTTLARQLAVQPKEIS